MRIATYNVMNLFSRAKPLAAPDWATGRPVLEDITRLAELIARPSYSTAVKDEMKGILKRNNLANRSRKDDLFRVNEVRKKLYTVPATGEINIKAAGRGSWLGWIEPVRKLLKSEAVQNTARVIDAVDADVLCVVEVEDRAVLERFHDDVLAAEPLLHPEPCQYPHNLLIDGNDDRGIDVGLYSRYPIRCVYSHIDDQYTGDDGKRYKVFSRDCPEFCVEIPTGDDLWLLPNHLKSKGYGSQESNDRKRKRQAERITKILDEYDLTSDLVVVSGDLNDTPGSDPLSPLLETQDLYDVLEKLSTSDRWTYKGGDQFDYLLVSRPIWDAIAAVGVERRGIYRQDAEDDPAQMFPEVRGIATQASDHGAVWIDVAL